jgi:hypothetical protein
MPDHVLADCLKQQFADAFDVLAGALGKFADDQWVTGRPPYDGPARATVHVLQCAEFYTSRDRGVWTRFGKPVWEMVDADLPSQQAMADYLAEARALTATWIDQLAERGLDGTDADSDTPALGRIVYALRHLQHHTGEVCCWQKQFGIPMTQWE